MNNQVSTESPEAQGVAEDVKKLEVPTVEIVEKWLARDITTCISLLNAIATDKELRLHVATFMHGRFSNHVNRPDPNQAELFPKRG